MATNPEGVSGALYDPSEENGLGGLNTLIGFVGNTATGAVTGPAGQVGVIHRIGHADTDSPGVVGYVEEPTP